MFQLISPEKPAFLQALAIAVSVHQDGSVRNGEIGFVFRLTKNVTLSVGGEKGDILP
ncbi:hypothetical protein [Paenibacillus ferrarius]|uniref:hypothetical protein n=1 Tax=Paenibacillus ferrarius TaxID=1469647 RepID=UPI0013019CC9|nr:hypothetical protein [Paenibacillus ferrarius]